MGRVKLSWTGGGGVLQVEWVSNCLLTHLRRLCRDAKIESSKLGTATDIIERVLLLDLRR